MPATSRSGRVGAAALRHRPTRLPLEVDQNPVLRGPQRLAQVQIAVDALVGDELATGALEHVARRRRVLGQLRHRVHRCVEAGGHVRHRRRRDRRAQLVGEHAVHHRDRLAQPVRLGGEVAAHLVGAAGRPRRSRSRALVTAIAQPSAAFST